MARLPRLTLPGFAHHIIQRGNNRQPIFLATADYQVMLDLLEENSNKFEVAIHAYVLMGNHFHLLATPQTADGLAQMMQSVGRRYVRYFNDRQRRTGTLWEGRFKSTLIQSERYLLSFFHRNRVDQLHSDRYVVTRHHHLFAFWQLDRSCHVRRTEVELGAVVVKERRMTATFVFGQDVDLAGEVGVRLD